MIHATELRIGNLLNQMLTSGKWEALPFEVQDFERLEMHPEYFNPIPLTEEWLLKFGFEKVNKYMYTFEVLEDISSKVTIISEGKIDIDLNDMWNKR